MGTKIESLTRYPFKGLSGEELQSVDLVPGQGFPNDRRFGFARPDSGFDPADPKPLPKTKFYMLARDADLARLKTEFDDDTGVLSIVAPTGPHQFDVTTAEGRSDANRFFKSFLALEEDEDPHLYEASPHRFTDVSVVSPEMMNAVSLINRDSVVRFSKKIGHKIDPRRFRGNILVSGLPSFAELDKIGKTVSIGTAKLKVVMRTKRCAATEVDPETGLRGLQVPKLLHKNYGHMDMGVYCEVVEGGKITVGDGVTFD